VSILRCNVDRFELLATTLKKALSGLYIDGLAIEAPGSIE
jgi:hypothetical protein